MSQEPHLAESWKSRFQHKAFTISEKKVSAQALTPGPKGVSQEPNPRLQLKNANTWVTRHGPQPENGLLIIS